MRAPGFVAWAALLALSLVLHLAGLTDRPFHSDEAIHAKLSLDVALQGRYAYDPAYHGPLLYYLTALCFLVFGDGDFVARLPAALIGVGFLWLAWRLKRPLGMKAAWWTGVLVTISPLFLYYGRFLAMDLLVMFAASASLLFLYEALRHDRAAAWPWAGFWAALAFGAKENAFVTVFLAVATWLMVAVACRWTLRPSRLVATAWTLRVSIAHALSIFVVVVLLLYTFFLTQPQDWRFAIDAVRYWTGQHDAARIGGPWWYHLFRIGVYEFLIMGAAVAWIARRQQVRPLEIALVCFGMSSIAMYAWLGEKTPWLALHQVWAFVPLAGAQLARTFGPRGRWWSRTIATVALGLTVAVTYRAVYLHHGEYPRDNRVEALHYATTVDGFHVVIDAASVVGPGADRYASVSGIGAWPLAWYWRHEPVRFGEPVTEPPPVVAVADATARDAASRILGDGYEWREAPVRLWWHAHERAPTIRELARYVLWREPWTDPIVKSAVLGVRTASP